MLMIVRAGLVGEEDARYCREISLADTNGSARDEDASYERSFAGDAVQRACSEHRGREVCGSVCWLGCGWD